MSNHRTSRQPRGDPFNRAVRKSRRRGKRWVKPALSLAVLATIALSQIELDAWMRMGAAPAAIGAERQGTGLQGAAHVIDGDTLDIGGTRIHLMGIDAPESAQPCLDAQVMPYACGAVATQALRHLIGSRPISCFIKTENGQNFAMCIVDGTDLGMLMVGFGQALANKLDYLEVELLAQSAGIGVWQGTFTAPWDWPLADRAYAYMPERRREQR